MKYLIFFVCALLAICVLWPAAGVAESATVMVSGAVYQDSLPAYGATVSLHAWDGSSMGSSPIKTVTTDNSGRFNLGEQIVDLGKPFNYAVKVQVAQYNAYALVYVTTSASGKKVAAPLSIDLLSQSGVGTLSGMVQSGNSMPAGQPIAGASVTLYSRDPSSGTANQVIGIPNPVSTDSKGKFSFSGLPYGLYLVEATKDTMGDRVEYAIYQQESQVNIKLTDTGTPYAPSPLPTLKATQAPPAPTATSAATATAKPIGTPTVKATSKPTASKAPSATPKSGGLPDIKNLNLPCCPALLLPLLLVGMVTLGVTRRQK